MKDPLNLKARQIVVQFPFSVPVTEEKTEEELARIAERRREQGRKLQEIAAKARMDKVHINWCHVRDVSIHSPALFLARAKGSGLAVSYQPQGQEGRRR